MNITKIIHIASKTLYSLYLLIIKSLNLRFGYMLRKIPHDIYQVTSYEFIGIRFTEVKGLFIDQIVLIYLLLNNFADLKVCTHSQ